MDELSTLMGPKIPAEVLTNLTTLMMDCKTLHDSNFRCYVFIEYLANNRTVHLLTTDEEQDAHFEANWKIVEHVTSECEPNTYICLVSRECKQPHAEKLICDNCTLYMAHFGYCIGQDLIISALGNSGIHIAHLSTLMDIYGSICVSISRTSS